MLFYVEFEMVHFNTSIADAFIESMSHLHILPHVWRGSTDVRHEKKLLRLKGQMRCIFLLQRFCSPVIKFLVLGFPCSKIRAQDVCAFDSGRRRFF